MLQFKTATGEIIRSKGGCRIAGVTEQGQQVSFNGVKAPVHKALLSAGEVTNKETTRS